MGEWAGQPEAVGDACLTYLKWGLAGCRHHPGWRCALGRLLEKSDRPQTVLVAYADWECAQAPPVEEVFALACDHPGSVILLDTHCKDAARGKIRSTLLDWLPAPWVQELCERAREAQVKIALAGSLGLAEIRTLLGARPNWFAVRGAVCDDGNRQGGVQLAKVRELARLLESAEIDEAHFQVQ
jgi:uncharacterized protein (UPF0264 family)